MVQNNIENIQECTPRTSDITFHRCDQISLSDHKEEPE